MGLKDFARRPDLTAAIVQAEVGVPPRRFASFPLPNGPKLRTMAVTDPLDDLRMRAVVARFVRTVDQHLPSKPTVAGYRLAKPPPGWLYEQGGRADKRRRTALEGLITGSSFISLVVTDVAQCYPSVRIEHIVDRMSRLGISPEVIGEAAMVLSVWQARDGCEGLPIGPEWSPTFAHLLLANLDRRLDSAGLVHVRWSDDVAIVITDETTTPTCVLELVDDSLADVTLTRSAPKTVIEHDPDEALRLVRDIELKYLGLALQASEPGVSQWVRSMFDEFCENPDPSTIRRFRFALRTMANRGDAYAVRRLAAEGRLLEVDPTTVGAYVARVAPTSRRDVARLLPMLEIPATDRTSAVHLHLLRGMSHAVWGEPEGDLFRNALGRHGPDSPISWWAAEALATTPRASVDEFVDRASTASTSSGRRRWTLPLRKSGQPDQQLAAARHLEGLDPRLGPTVEFVVAA